MRVLLFGSRGFIAGKLMEAFPEAIPSDIDITDRALVRGAIEDLCPDAIINAAGKTGRPNVDWCEDHKIETIASNVTGPLVLLDECLRRRLYFVHIGSGCIYQGDNGGKGFTEDDEPNFTGSFYSFSKCMVDRLLARFPVLQLRLRMPFDGVRNPRNLITKLSAYPRVLDAENSLTYLPDLVRVTRALVERRATGMYNVTNPGAASPYRIMQRYRDVVDPSHAFSRLRVEDLSEVAKAARSNCILSSEKLALAGLAMTPVDDAIEEALAAMAGKHEIRLL